MARKRVRVRTHWWRTESGQKFRSWESTVFGGAAFETQLTSEQLKPHNPADDFECTNKGYVVREWGFGGYGIQGL